MDLEGQIAHARTVERVLSWLGWLVVVVGTIALLAVVVGYVTGEIGLEQAVLAAAGTVIGTILSGASAYGSATNVGLGASRLELSAPKHPQPEPSGQSPAA